MKSRSHQRMSFQVPQANTKGKTCSRKYHIVTHEDKGCKDSQKVSVRLLKRASPYSSTVLEAYTGNIQTAKAVEKEGKRQRLHSHTFQEKVDAVAYPGEILSEKYTSKYFYKRLSGHHDLERARVRNVVNDCSLAERSDENDSDDDACSVGSCSVNSWKDNRLSYCSRNLHCLERDLLFDDDESFYCSADKEENCFDHLEQKVEVSVRSLELHAYRCTLEALYVSGPLSWEQEELLTNLRIMLHISNDEHLTELRNLIPSGTSK